jgi:hydroxymethylbilane synthase
VALIDGEIDVAVHSMKDVPTQQKPELVIGAILKREDPRDAFVSVKHTSVLDLPQGALVGTASLRRQAQLAHIRPDVKFCLLRGNVGTRISKLEQGECEATFLAYAGLKRLEMDDVATEIIDLDTMLCAPAQGAIGIEMRTGDLDVASVVRGLDDPDTHVCVSVERAFLSALDGSCRTPIAALAEVRDDALSFRGEVFSLDGQEKFEDSWSANISDVFNGVDLGNASGKRVLEAIGGRNIWKEPGDE